MAMRNRSRPTTGAIGGMRKGCSGGTAVLVWSGDRRRRGTAAGAARRAPCSMDLTLQRAGIKLEVYCNQFKLRVSGCHCTLEVRENCIT